MWLLSADLIWDPVTIILGLIKSIKNRNCSEFWELMNYELTCFHQIMLRELFLYIV